jgi:hypothetical protein
VPTFGHAKSIWTLSGITVITFQNGLTTSFGRVLTQLSLTGYELNFPRDKIAMNF